MVEDTIVDVEIVLPTLNEERRIGPTVSRLTAYLETRPWSSRITVVDNGCTDRTTEAVDAGRGSSIPMAVIGCSTPGKGAAVRRGILAANARRVGFMDADLSTPVETLDLMMAAMDSGAEAVIGSRRCSGAAYLTEQSVGRRLGGLLFRAATRSVAPNISDTQCGFKFFDAAVAQMLFSDTSVNGFAFDVEILHRAVSADLRIREVPVLWADSPHSTFRPLTHGVASFRELRSVMRQSAALQQQAAA